MTTTPFNEGRRAAKEGRNINDNPYEGVKENNQQKDNCYEWYEGFESHEGNQGRGIPSGTSEVP